MTAPAPMPVPPWMAMLQAHADRAEAVLAAGNRPALVDMPRRAGEEQLARDIANSAYADVTGTRHRPATHRKEQQS